MMNNNFESLKLETLLNQPIGQSSHLYLFEFENSEGLTVFKNNKYETILKE